MIQAGTPAQVADAVLTTLSRAGTGPGAHPLPAIAELTGRPARPFSAWAIRHIAAFRQGA
jgi:(4-alkanoyl-5-oxo-2,5-dihydrofuran-3-yl)methyl phosphate reductase